MSRSLELNKSLDLEKSGENMKKVILWIILLILLIAITPITAGIKQEVLSVNTENTTSPKATEASDIKLNEDETKAVISNVMEYITEDYSTECKKAMVALCKNNALVQKSNGLKPRETQVSKFTDSFYEELSELLRTDKTKISIDGKREYIPIINISPGFIVEDPEYPYISSVACPWDLQSPQYQKRIDYNCGISVNGIESLCTIGLDHIYVLSYFLPMFSIN